MGAETVAILIASVVIAGASFAALAGEALLRWRARHKESSKVTE